MAEAILILGAVILICGAGIAVCARDWQDGRMAIKIMILGILIMLLTLLCLPVPADARDPDGRYAAQNPELHQWFEGLRSGKGPCCSDADGASVADVDWETKDGHYRVRLDGEWIDVPDEAVITEPNKIGRTMVWPIRGYLGTSIRCFMPGPMT